VFGQSTGVFNRTGDMTTARAGHTATLLPDGRVLIVGGASQGPLAEAYDPSTGAFSPADDMITSRDGHTAILLPDGNVIIPGGIVLQDGRTLIVSSPTAEVYDPASGTCTLTGAYADPIPSWATATLLLDGRVLLTGCAARCSIGATELFDPQTGTFGLTGPKNGLFDDVAITATLLTDGTILFVESYFDRPLNYVEVYDPAAGTFTHIADLIGAHGYSAAVRLRDGTVLITGGQLAGGNSRSDTVRYL